MKLILFGFFRRWWLWYLGGLLFATILDVLHGVLPLPWMPYLFAPWLGGLLLMLDLISRASGLTLALPVATKTVARAYWMAGVCAPPILLVLAQCLAALFATLLGIPTTSVAERLLLEFGGPDVDLLVGLSGSPSWWSLSLNLVISTLLSGFSIFAATFLPVNSMKQSGNTLESRIWNLLSALGIMLLFNASLFSACGMPMILDSVQSNPVAIISVLCLGIIFLILGYLRSEAMLLSWARKRPQAESPERSLVPFRPGAVFASSGLLSLFFDTFRMTLVMVCSVVLGGIVFKTLRSNWVFIHYTLFFCSIIPALRFTQSLRPLRALPVSTSRLAFTLFLLPMANAALYLGLLCLVWRLGWGLGMTGMELSPIVLTVGIACLSGGVCSRFGPKALALLAFLGVWLLMIFVYLGERFHFPAIWFWVPGLALMVASLFLLRRWLTSSQTYRFRGEAGAAI
jgi:hypothetical protein